MNAFDWTRRAACIGAPDAVFFPSQFLGSATAKAICARCPVSTLCLTACLKAEAWLGEQSRRGIFGGLTADERAQLARRS